MLLRRPKALTPNRALLQRVDYVIDGIDYPISLGHDDLGRTSQIDYPDLGNGPAVSVKYHYDGFGALTNVGQATSTGEKSLWTMTDAFEGHLLKSEVLGDSSTTTYGYTDAQHWLTSIQTATSAGPVQSLAYTQTNIGQVLTRTNNLTGNQLTYDYDPLDRLVKETPSSGTPTDYAYDDAGNLIQRGASTVTH